MQNLTLSDIKPGMTVYYIPTHEDKVFVNAEAGVVSSIKGDLVFVRYTSGDTAAGTNISDLYK